VAVAAGAGVVAGVADASGLDVGADCSPQPAINSPAVAAATEMKKGVFMPTDLDAVGGGVFTESISREWRAIQRV
jgi:hypothetical protein